MNTLVIGDLHLDNKVPGLLENQVQTVKRIIKENKDVMRIVFLGDVFMMRRPKPSVLLAFKEILRFIDNLDAFVPPDVVVLRGNHDSENKNDDGITGLSLFDYPWLKIVTQTWAQDGMCYIPHYEDEDAIRKALAWCEEDFTCFGHFGYFGGLNSAGDNDFSLVPNDFKCDTYLGHIHHFKQDGKVTVVGTPYTTNFTEAGKDNVVALLGDHGDKEFYHVNYGPRHLVFKAEDLGDSIDFINDPKYFTMLRIIISTQGVERESLTSMIEQLDVGYLEVKFSPVIRDIHELSDYDPDEPVYALNDDIIEEYVNHSETKLGKDTLLEGLRLINENQRNRN